MDRPISLAECDGSLDFSITVLAAEISMNLYPTSGIADCFDLQTTGSKLVLECHPRRQIDLFDMLNSMISSKFLYLDQLRRYDGKHTRNRFMMMVVGLFRRHAWLRVR